MLASSKVYDGGSASPSTQGTRERPGIRDSAAGNSSTADKAKEASPSSGGLFRAHPWAPRGSPHDEVVPIHIWTIARAPQVTRVPHDGAAPALVGVPETVWVLAWYYLEQLLQHLIGVV